MERAPGERWSGFVKLVWAVDSARRDWVGAIQVGGRNQVTKTTYNEKVRGSSSGCRGEDVRMEKQRDASRWKGEGAEDRGECVAQ